MKKKKTLNNKNEQQNNNFLKASNRCFHFLLISSYQLFSTFFTRLFEWNPIVAYLISLVCQIYPFASFTRTFIEGVD
jgi:hypothetical protein